MNPDLYSIKNQKKNSGHTKFHVDTVVWPIDHGFHKANGRDMEFRR